MAYTKNCKLNRGDFISWLPDDILLNILSRLAIKEQARTSILSSRWTHLWTLSSCLNIAAEDFVQKESNRPIKTLTFIDTVDQILAVHSGQAIDQLKIIFPVDPCVKFPDTLRDSWLKIAHQKQVPCVKFPDNLLDCWTKIAQQKQVKVLHLDFKLKHSKGYCGRKFPRDFTTFSSLITLRLENVFLSNNFIHGILSNSPNLLEMSIINCNRFLGRLYISGPFLKLKHLELIGSYILPLEISTPNLVSFNFICQTTTCPVKVRFKNVPLLTQLSCSARFILQAWHEFYVLLPQLVTLTLTLSENSKVGDIGNFPVLANLKQMHVRFLSDYDKHGLRCWLQELFRASPYVSRLSFDLGTHTPKHNFIKNFPDHKFLEELEIYNFKGFEYESRLLIRIVESCPSLQKIVIHPNSSKRKAEWKALLRSWGLKRSWRLCSKSLTPTIVFKVVNTDNF